MRHLILSLAAIVGLAVLPSSVQAQVVAQYYGRPYFYNYNSSNYNAYHQRLQRLNALRYGRSYSSSSPYQHRNYWNNRNYYNALRNRQYHRGLGRSAYNNPYYRYGGSGVYYNSPGFGLRLSF